jgi:hypothetical protein
VAGRRKRRIWGEGKIKLLKKEYQTKINNVMNGGKYLLKIFVICTLSIILSWAEDVAQVV